MQRSAHRRTDSSSRLLICVCVCVCDEKKEVTSPKCHQQLTYRLCVPACCRLDYMRTVFEPWQTGNLTRPLDPHSSPEDREVTKKLPYPHRVLTLTSSRDQPEMFSSPSAACFTDPIVRGGGGFVFVSFLCPCSDARPFVSVSLWEYEREEKKEQPAAPQNSTHRTSRDGVNSAR